MAILVIFCLVGMAVAVVNAYYWSVVMLAWGIFWPFLIIVLLTSRYFFTLATCVLCQKPHIRCPKCRRVYTIRFDHDDFIKTTYEKGSDIKRGDLLGKSTSKYQTWDKVTTRITYGDGHSRTYTENKNYKDHKVEHRTYELLNFEVTYKLDHYISHYICGKCKFEEELPWVNYTEVDRKYVGSTTTTESQEV